MNSLEGEIWKPISINPNYMISNMGRIKSVDHPIWCKVNNSYSIRKGKILKPSNTNSKKYWRIAIVPTGGTKADKKFCAIHRLVAEAFLPNPENLPQINHIDGNKNNNCVSNLEWCSQSHNLRHAYDNGLISKEKESKNCHLRKLTEEQVSYIKAEYDRTLFAERGDKMRFCEAMQKKFGLKSKNTIFWIIQGGTNKYITADQLKNFKL